jgi:hypothetical protein
MFGCVTVQTFIAGMAVFTNPIHWQTHTTFVHLFEFLPLLMLVFAFAGKLSSAMRWQSTAIFVLIIAQYATANIPSAGAVHPVIALVLFWLTLSAATQATRLVRRRDS